MNNPNEISLKKYFDAKIKSLNLAVKVAAKSLKGRLRSMNEFRSQLTDQAKTFITRSEFDSVMGKMQEDIRILRESKASLEGKASRTSVYVTIGIAGVAIFISIVNLVIQLFKV